MNLRVLVTMTEKSSLKLVSPSLSFKRHLGDKANLHFADMFLSYLI
jgi:hypothetical protein